MPIGGIQKTSLIDYPNGLSTVLFFKGCNFKCPYCHNAELISFDGEALNEEEILKELSRRSHLIDAVVLSGGESLLSDNLLSLTTKIRSMGYKIKLDTNGSNPDALKEMIEHGLLDYVAMDVKAPLEKYHQVTGVEVDLAAIQKSIDLIVENIREYEFRTTVCHELLDKDDLIKIAYWIKGAKKFVIQNFRDGQKVMVGKHQLTPYTKEELISIQNEIKPWFNEVIVRL